VILSHFEPLSILHTTLLLVGKCSFWVLLAPRVDSVFDTTYHILYCPVTTNGISIHQTVCSFCNIHPEDGDCDIWTRVGTAAKQEVAKPRKPILCISHTHEDPSLLGCYAMLMGKQVLMFPRTLMPLYSGSISTRRRHLNPLKCWSIFTNQHSRTSLKTRNVSNTSVRTSDLTH
jgi:hypothetical protein